MFVNNTSSNLDLKLRMLLENKVQMCSKHLSSPFEVCESLLNYGGENIWIYGCPGLPFFASYRHQTHFIALLVAHPLILRKPSGNTYLISVAAARQRRSTRENISSPQERRKMSSFENLLLVYNSQDLIDCTECNSHRLPYSIIFFLALPSPSSVVPFRGMLLY